MMLLRYFLPAMILASFAASVLADDAADWYQWRGPARDARSSETGLLDSWPADGPPLAWRTAGIGNGFSSVTTWDGRLYTMGKKENEVHLICLSEHDGSEVWSTVVGTGDAPNCSPTVDPESGLAFGLSHAGDLLCADGRTGKVMWRKNFPQDFGGKMMSMWGYSESPLVDGDRLICTPGSDSAILAALDKKTGQTIWATRFTQQQIGPAGKDGAGYSSIVVGNCAGVKQYIQLVGRGVVSVAAKDGRPLWAYNRIANTTANVPTPIVSGNRVFCTTGYDDGGSALIEIRRSGQRMNVREIWYKSAKELQNHHGGVVLHEGNLYFGHGHNNGFPVCVDLKTGNSRWPRTRGAGSGSAAVLYADGHFYFRYEDGTMALIEANPSRYNLKGTFRIASRNGKSWPHPVIHNGRLFLRDQHELLCYDLRRDAN